MALASWLLPLKSQCDDGSARLMTARDRSTALQIRIVRFANRLAGDERNGSLRSKPATFVRVIRERPNALDGNLPGFDSPFS